MLWLTGSGITFIFSLLLLSNALVIKSKVTKREVGKVFIYAILFFIIAVLCLIIYLKEIKVIS